MFLYIVHRHICINRCMTLSYNRGRLCHLRDDLQITRGWAFAFVVIQSATTSDIFMLSCEGKHTMMSPVCYYMAPTISKSVRKGHAIRVSRSTRFTIA